MEENNQINDMGTPAAEVPVTPAPVPEASVQPEATPEVVVQPAEVPVTPEVTPEVAPAEAPTITLEPAAPVEPEVTPAPVEAAPVTPEVVVQPAEVPVTPEVAPAVEPAPVVESTPVAPVEAPALPVVDPVPAVSEMPEAVPAEMPAQPEGVITPELAPTEAPADGGAPVEEEKKSKTGLIIAIVAVLVVALVAVYFLFIKGKDEPEPNNTTVESTEKYFSSSNGVELKLDEKNKTFVLVTNDGEEIVYTGTYTKSDSEYTFTKEKSYQAGNCGEGTEEFTLIIKEDGSLSGTEGLVSGFELSTSSESKNEKAAKFSPNTFDCEAGSIEPVANETKEENKTVEKNETKEEENKTVEVESIKLDTTKKEFDAKGGNFTLKVTFTPKDPTDKTITWKSSDEKVATVDKNGKVTVKENTETKEKKATITAETKNGKKATCEVTLKAKAEETPTPVASKPDCPSKYDPALVDVEGEEDYERFKDNLSSKIGQDAGSNAAKECKTHAEIIEIVKKAVEAEAKKCWSDAHVKKAVETAECKLTVGCDKDSASKQTSIESIWTNNNCTGLTY